MTVQRNSTFNRLDAIQPTSSDHFISAKWTKWMGRYCFSSMSVCLSVSVCVQQTSHHDPLKIFRKGPGSRDPLNFWLLNAISSKMVKTTDFKFEKHVSGTVWTWTLKNYYSVKIHLAEICTLTSAFNRIYSKQLLQTLIQTINVKKYEWYNFRLCGPLPRSTTKSGQIGYKLTANKILNIPPINRHHS